jgi:23S rRNA pseudouridine2605 synthase
MALERLQKIIAAAGIASRRKAEDLIQAGLVSVNGATVTELGTKADPETDSIRVQDKVLQGPERHEYVALNKPRGYVTTVSDPEGRPTVMELLRSKARLYPVGRLDFNSEGLLLLTNDGDLAHKLMKAASHIPKTYLVKVAGQPGEDQLRRLRAGVTIAEERDPNRRIRTAPAQIRVIKEADNPWLEVTLHEGRNRQIRKMFEEIGHHVEKIRRVRYGPLELDLPPGESRILTSQEIARLQHATEPQIKPRFDERGGDRRGERIAAPRGQFRERAVERPKREYDREQRLRFTDRPRRDFAARPQREDRGERMPGFDGRNQRPERPSQFGPPGRREEGPTRPPRSFDRPRREVRSREDRGGREGRGERRPPFGGRVENRERGERPAFSGRPRQNNRGERPNRFTDRPPRREQRDSRPSRFADQRSERGERQPRSSSDRTRVGAESSSARPSKFSNRGGRRPASGPGSDRGSRPGGDRKRPAQGTRFGARGRNAGEKRESSRGPTRGNQRGPKRGNRGPLS